MLRSLNANYLKEIQILQLINQTFHIKENQLKMAVETYQYELNQTKIEMALLQNEFKLEVASLKNLTEINKIAAESYRNESEAYKNEADSCNKYSGSEDSVQVIEGHFHELLDIPGLLHWHLYRSCPLHRIC